MPDMDSQLTYEFGEYRLLPGQRQLIAGNGKPIRLRGKAFELLHYLVQHRGRLVEKTELMGVLWPNAVVEENNLNQAISALRQALGETAQLPRYVATITGRGYQFVGDVEVVDDSSPSIASVRRSASPGKRRLVLGGIAVVIAVALSLFLRSGDGPVESDVPVLDLFSEITPRLVTDFHGSHSEPTLSPDGTMMAWVSDVNGIPQIWVKNLQSGDPIQITDGEFAASSPTWSPDNSGILYSRAGSGGPAIFSVGTLGTPEPRLIIERGISPSYALDADTFVYSTGQQIWIATGEGRDYRRIDGIPIGPGFAQRMPALSPDGSSVAFIHADGGPLGNLWVIPSSGGEARQLTSLELSDSTYAEAPVWSSDGRFIVYTVNVQGVGSQLWRISLESGEAVPLSSGSGGADQAVVSADGKRLAYTNTRTSWRLTRMDPANGSRYTIFESRHPIFLPYASRDGGTIVFFSSLSSGSQLFTIGSDGRQFRQLTFNDGGTNVLPVWSDDGASIYYYRDRSLHRLFLDEGRDQEIIADFHWSSRNWVAIHGDQLAYHEYDRASGFQRAAIRDMTTGTEVELPVPIEGAEWSVDGSELLGTVRKPFAIRICELESLQCRPVIHAGTPVLGFRPKWSRDERSIYYLRRSEKGDCCNLWVVDRDGSFNTELFELNGYELEKSYFGIDEQGMVFYNHMDSSADEIWLAAVE